MGHISVGGWNTSNNIYQLRWPWTLICSTSILS